MDITIQYEDVDILVSKEVADFLEQDRKRIQNESRSDRRHISRTNIEKLSGFCSTAENDMPSAVNLTISEIVNEDTIIHDLFLKSKKETLLKAIKLLTADEQKLIFHYYYENLSMQKVGEKFDISKMAISKRINKLLQKLRSLMET